MHISSSVCRTAATMTILYCMLVTVTVTVVAETTKSANAATTAVKNSTQLKNATVGGTSGTSNATTFAPPASEEVAGNVSKKSSSAPEGNGTVVSDKESEDGPSGNETDSNANSLKVLAKKMTDYLNENKNVVQTTMFVLIGLTSLVVLYFIVRTMRLKQKKSKSRKYGVLTNGMEMDHLESDSDDEDTTVFEINRR